MSAKSTLSRLLKPAAQTARGLDGLRRLWAHASLAACIEGDLDPSVVVLGTPEIHGTGRIRLGRDLFLYRELYLETQEQGALEIGDRVVISRGVHLVSYSRLRIGDDSLIGEYSSIRDANHRLQPGVAVRGSGHDAAPIEIGRNVWIGRGVTVLGGVTIGDHAVIGANAVVTRDVEAGCVAAGVPARVIREAVTS